jgi:hypothetical protein
MNLKRFQAVDTRRHWRKNGDRLRTCNVGSCSKQVPGLIDKVQCIIYGTGQYDGLKSSVLNPTIRSKQLQRTP